MKSPFGCMRMLARRSPELFNFTDVTSNAVRGCATRVCALTNNKPVSTYVAFNIGEIPDSVLVTPMRQSLRNKITALLPWTDKRQLDGTDTPGLLRSLSAVASPKAEGPAYL